jgi:uncharacterized protein
MAVSSYKHGVTWRDVPTSIVAPVTADSGIPFFVGTTPIQQVKPENRPKPNTPRVYYSYEDAVLELGYSDDWRTYNLSQAIYVYFALFNVGPIICSYLNGVDDTFYQSEPEVDDPFTFVKGICPLVSENILPETLVVKGATDSAELVLGTDYMGAWQKDPRKTESNEYYYTLSAIPGGKIPLDVDYPVLLSYTEMAAINCNRSQIIGGMDINTGTMSGIEVIEDVFPKLSIVPGILIIPFWSQDPEIAAVMSNKVDEINGCFRCITYTDLDSSVVLKAMDAYEWKNQNNYVHGRQTALWPRVGLGNRDIWLSTELGARTQKTDIDNGNIPVETPSNKNLEMNKTLVGDFGGKGDTPPTEVVFSKDYADMLNGQGIITAINWIGGWKAWGSNMSCYPFITDPKDRWLPARRMTDFVGNSLVLTIFQKVDKPTNRRLIDTIVDTTNIWLNGLVSSGSALGARVEFRHDENPDTEMINGHYIFHVYEFFPLPAEWIEFRLELDISYLSVLFSQTATVAA